MNFEQLFSLDLNLQRKKSSSKLCLLSFYCFLILASHANKYIQEDKRSGKIIKRFQQNQPVLSASLTSTNIRLQLLQPSNLFWMSVTIQVFQIFSIKVTVKASASCPEQPLGSQPLQCIDSNCWKIQTLLHEVI